MCARSEHALEVNKFSVPASYAPVIAQGLHLSQATRATRAGAGLRVVGSTSVFTKTWHTFTRDEHEMVFNFRINPAVTVQIQTLSETPCVPKGMSRYFWSRTVVQQPDRQLLFYSVFVHRFACMQNNVHTCGLVCTLST